MGFNVGHCSSRSRPTGRPVAERRRPCTVGLHGSLDCWLVTAAREHRRDCRRSIWLNGLDWAARARVLATPLLRQLRVAAAADEDGDLYTLPFYKASALRSTVVATEAGSLVGRWSSFFA